MKAKPVIALILGCLIMVIMGHNIVPHHHHPGTLNSHSGCEQQYAYVQLNSPEQQNACEQENTCEQENACDHSRNHKCKSEEPAEHCHAFNGLEFVVSFEKQIDKEPLAETSSSFLISLIFKDDPLPREVYFGCSGVPPPEFTGFLGESSGLRAPPVIS